VFFGDDILTNGAAQAFSGTTSTKDPVFFARRDKPGPWYHLSTRTSPAYHSSSAGKNRGAYQIESLRTGTILRFR
jgi:hypothetical protein